MRRFTSMGFKASNLITSYPDLKLIFLHQDDHLKGWPQCEGVLMLDIFLAPALCIILHTMQGDQLKRGLKWKAMSALGFVLFPQEKSTWNKQTNKKNRERERERAIVGYSQETPISTLIKFSATVTHSSNDCMCRLVIVIWNNYWNVCVCLHVQPDTSHNHWEQCLE